VAHDVFISYSSKDKATADAACALLERNSIRCWIAPRDILPGQSWGASIIDAINGSRAMVLVFSGHANASPQVEREIERAVNRSLPIIPLRIEDVSPTKSLEYFISTPHWLDALTPPLDKHLERLSAIVHGILSPDTARTPEPDTAAAPRKPAGRRDLRVAAGAALGGCGLLAAWLLFVPGPVSSVVQSAQPETASPPGQPVASAPAPASAEALAAGERFGTVLVQDLAVRLTPNEFSSIRAFLNRGMRVVVVARQVSAGTQDWLFIRSITGSGWVRSGDISY
jgi:hypothetical protein